MEYWGIKENINPSTNTPSLQDNNTPTLQYSKTPKF